MWTRIQRLRSRIAADESGMSLFEVTLSTFIFGFVLIATVGLLDASTKMAPRERERAHAIRDAQVGVGQMVRELRQGYQMLSITSHSIEILVRVPRDDPSTTAVEEYSNRRVQYDCGEANPGECVRYEALPNEALTSTGTTVLPRVLNANPSSTHAVFSVASGDNPILASYIKVLVEVPAKGEQADGHSHTVVLEDGFYARNLPQNTS